MGHNKTNPRWLHTVVDSVYSGRGADDGYRTANIKKKKKKVRPVAMAWNQSIVNQTQL